MARDELVEVLGEFVGSCSGYAGESEGEVGFAGAIISGNAPGSLGGTGAEACGYALKGLLRCESQDVTA